jgi:aminopeptidase-like protein
MMYELLKQLFPITRSITGEGMRTTLNLISEKIPLRIVGVPSGEKAFDWEVPDEWNIQDAWVKNSRGEKVIDFKASNLHIVNYSIPFEGELSLAELKKHLYSLPDMPDAIPYVTSYYERKWGFCISHNKLDKLADDTYHVKIDSSIEPGEMNYGELIIPGESSEEILLSTYICHPSMANNELSGPVVTIALSKWLMNQDFRKYTYRILFLPETIGAIVYLSKNLDHLKKRVVGGYVITCIGDPGKFSYLKTRRENCLVDRITQHVLDHSVEDYNLYTYLERGSDERQYNYPGVDLDIGSLMRSKYREYPEYHTSLDNLDFVTSDALEESLEMYKKCIQAFENNRIYHSTTLCEPMLSKHNLYTNRNTSNTAASVVMVTNILNYCDGDHDLLDIAKKLNYPIWDLSDIVGVLLAKDLLRIQQNI